MLNVAWKFLTHSCLVTLVLAQGPAMVMGDEEAVGLGEVYHEGSGRAKAQRDAELEAITEGVYGGLDRFHFMIIPLVNAGVGVFMGGTKGALLGLLAGGVDELLINAGIEQAYYLSAAFLGAGTLDKLALPYHANHVIGGLGGVGIASGQLDALKNYVGRPVQGAVNGMVYGGTSGAVAGGVGGILDEVLKATGVVQGDYASKIILGLAQAKALGTAAGMIAYLPKIGDPYTRFLSQNPLPRGTTEMVAALLIAFRIYNQGDRALKEEEGPGNAKTSFDIIEAFDETLSLIMDPEKLHALLQQQVIVMVALPLISSQLSIKLQKHCQTFETQLSKFETIQPDTGKRFFEAISYLAIFIIPYVAESFMAELLNDYQGRILASEVQDIMRERLMKGEMLLKLARHNGTGALLDLMDSNLYSVAATGEFLLSKIAESQVKGIYGLCTLSQHRALDFSVFAQFLDDLLMTMGAALSEMENTVLQDTLPIRSKVNSLQKEWHKNPRDIVYGGKQVLFARKEAELLEELRALYQKQALLGVTSQGFF